MTTAQPPKRLPDRPSAEHLRKQAKRLATAESIKLAEAQHRLAIDYGHRRWDELMQAVEQAMPRFLLSDASDATLRPLSKAARDGDAAEVRRLLAATTPVRTADEINGPLWHVAFSDAPTAIRLSIAGLLLDAGASPRHHHQNQTTALHAAAWRGPLTMVELLIRRGALSWMRDLDGREPLDYARDGVAADKDAIVDLLDRPVIRDPNFRQAVRLIHAGDAEGLGRFLDVHPNLLRDPAIEPDCYPSSYFKDPRLFWFVANNPTLMKRIPATIVEVAKAMISRGVNKADLDYTLELVMTSSPAREQGHQLPLMGALLDAGAQASPRAIEMTLAHWELEPVRTLLDRGLPMTAPIAASFGDARLGSLLASASPEDRQAALGLAVINRQLDATRLCLDAGADPSAFLPVHAHSTPLHQAALHDDVPMLTLLLDRGARADIKDTLWDSTPLGWAVHQHKRRAEAYLRERLRAPEASA